MFSDLTLKVGAESAVLAAHRNLAKLGLFAKSFSELAGTAGQSIAVPVYNFLSASDFGDNNNYGTGSNEVGGVLVNLNKHLVKSVSITDIQLAETGITWMKDTASALADTLTRGVNKYVFDTISADTDVTLTASFNPTSKAVVASLYSAAEQNDIPVDRSVVVLTPTKYAAVLSLIGDTSVYGSDGIIKNGIIEGIYGFKAIVCGPIDAIICDEAVGIASRYVQPATDGAYPETFSATTEDGFTIGFRRFMDLNTGSNKFAADVLVGAKVIQPTKIVKLV